VVPMRVFDGRADRAAVRRAQNVKVAIKSLAKRARIGVAVSTSTCGGKACFSRFVHQAFALQHAERGAAQSWPRSRVARNSHFVFDQRMSSDYQGALHSADSFSGGGFSSACFKPLMRSSAVYARAPESARRKKMLDGEEFPWAPSARPGIRFQ